MDVLARVLRQFQAQLLQAVLKHSAAFPVAGLGLGQLVVACGVAMVAVSWAFDGWNNVNFAAGDEK